MKPAPDGSVIQPADAADSTANTPDDPRLLAALDEYLATVEAGRRPDRQGFLARHAAIAEPLAKAIEGLEFIHQTASRPNLRSANNQCSSSQSAAAEPPPIG
jgi:hypothetical protein